MGHLRSLGLKPAVEQVERRRLLSAITDILAAQSQPYHPTNPSVATQSQSASAIPPLVNPGVAPPIAPGPGNPTPRELAREKFHAYFSGPYNVGPPRFTSQSKIFFYRGLGGSTQFLHGDFQMQIDIPKETGSPIVGAIYLQDRNLNSSGALGLDLTIDPSSFDRLGRPTQATFTQDPNIYSGVDFVDTASGSLTIRYSGNTATVKLNGLLYVSGLTDPLRNMDLQARGG